MTLVLDLDETLVHSTENPSSQRNRGGTYLPHDEIISIPQTAAPASWACGDNSPGNNEAPLSGEKRGGGRGGGVGQAPPPPSPPREKRKRVGLAAARAETPYSTPLTPRRQGSSVSGGSGGAARAGGTKSIYVWKRPFLDVFLREAARHYEIVVYTAGYQRYANQVIDRIDSTASCAEDSSATAARRSTTAAAAAAAGTAEAAAPAAAATTPRKMVAAAAASSWAKSGEGAVPQGHLQAGHRPT